MILNCEYCHEPFPTEHSDRKCCSVPCKLAMHSEVDADRVRDLARAGCNVTDIGAHLGAHRKSVTRTLCRIGLYREWQRRRYAKCA